MERPFLHRPLPLRRSAQQKKAAEARRMDPFMRALKALHSIGSPDSIDPEELEKQRKSQDLIGRLTAPMSGLDWECSFLDTLPVAWMRLKNSQGHRRVILYCHGGGYTSGNLGYSKVLSSKLCSATGFDVFSFEYRLAPEHPYPAALEDAMTAWDYLRSQGYSSQNILLAGDSAGGNLALVLCHRLRQLGQPLPGALLLFSPWTDLTLSGDSLTSRAEIDPMLTRDYVFGVRDAYCAGQDPADPLLSPLLGDFSGFPPTIIQVGTHEILYSDSERLAQCLEQAGCPCRLEVWEDMWHVFQMFPHRKAAEAIRSVSRFLLAQL